VHACDATDQIPDLIATARSVESAYLEWARQSRAGMRRLGDLHSIATYRRTTTFRIHEPAVLPGIFRPGPYIRRMLAFLYAFLDAPDNVDATVAMKAEPTAIALSPAKRMPWSSANRPCTPDAATRRNTPSSSTTCCR
jgi:hypothetical protein